MKGGGLGCAGSWLSLTWGVGAQELPQLAAELDHVIQLPVDLRVLHPGWHAAHGALGANTVTHAAPGRQRENPSPSGSYPCTHHQLLHSPERISGFSSDKKPTRVSHKCRTGLIYHGKWQDEHHLAAHFHALSGQPWKTQCLTSWPKFSKAPLLFDSRWQLGFTVATTHSFTTAVLQPSIFKQGASRQPTGRHNFHFLLVSICLMQWPSFTCVNISLHEDLQVLRVFYHCSLTLPFRCQMIMVG